MGESRRGSVWRRAGGLRRLLVLVAACGSALAATASAAPPAPGRLETAPGRAAPAATRPPPVDARLQGLFLMRGRVTDATGVKGEQAGARFTTRWSLAETCALAFCPMIRVQRQRAAGGVDTVVLGRRAPGIYTGYGRYAIPLVCKGRYYPAGGAVRFFLKVAVAATQSVDAVAFATVINAGYGRVQRTNQTRCRGRLGHDAAVYTGELRSGVPMPPVAAFTVTPAALAGEVTFVDTSRVTTRGAAITGWAWDFGDPASGAANTASTPAATHTYPASGAYTATLAVADSNGLTATTTRPVTIP